MPSFPVADDNDESLWVLQTPPIATTKQQQQQPRLVLFSQHHHQQKPSTRRSTSVATATPVTHDDFTTPAKPEVGLVAASQQHEQKLAAARTTMVPTDTTNASQAVKVTPNDPHKDVLVVPSPPLHLPLLTSTLETDTTTTPAAATAASAQAHAQAAAAAQEAVDCIRATVTSSPLEHPKEHEETVQGGTREDTATPLQSNTQNHQSLASQQPQVQFDSAESAMAATAAAVTASCSNEQQQQDATCQNKRGLVSRRGRYVSPGQRSTPVSSSHNNSASSVVAVAAAVPPPTSEQGNNKDTFVRDDYDDNDNSNHHDDDKTIAEFKTFRSPPRNSSSSNRQQQQQHREEQEVPSLCSAGSGEQNMKQPTTTTKSLPYHQEDTTSLSDRRHNKHKNHKHNNNNNKAPALSISCDPSLNAHTSPLATMMDSMGTTTSSSLSAAVPLAPTHSSTARMGGTKPPASHEKKALSPPREKAPSDDAAKLLSPGGAVFLSPKRAMTNQHHHQQQQQRDIFEEKKGDENHHNSHKTPPRGDRHRVATPTDFSTDFGKNNPLSSSFDTSNVLAWLQSPTANGLFSPGGYGSILNTPGGPRTPRTPTVSTSFFFSDVASLPRAGPDATSSSNSTLTPPKGGGENSATKLQQRNKQGISNIICISPLASSKARNGATPTNLREIFASPEKSKVRSLPLLQDSATPATKQQQQSRVPQRSSSKDPSLDAVHLAERDLMEDEDMCVLLRLAANTPRSNALAAGVVFRSPMSVKDGANKKHGGESSSSSSNFPALQLPMIGGQEGGPSSARFAARKPTTEHDDFAPPQLGMRSSSSSGSKEIVAGAPRVSNNKRESSTAGGGNKGENDNKSKATKGISSSSNASYPMHPPFPPQRDMPYYPMPGGMPPGMPPGPGGSMRVVVGGPPPPKGSPSRGGMSGSPHPPPPHYHDYPPPYAPPGMYSQYGPPIGYPYQGHYPPPPPRPMPMYGAQHTSSGSKKGGKGVKPKSPTKRAGLSLLDPKGAKKIKRAPSTGTKKKKTATPPITDRVERQKAAANVHAVNAASGGKNDRAAALAAAILRGVTMRPSGKWQAQLYFAGKSRYIGVFDTREKAALAYEIAREKLKAGPNDPSGRTTENLVNAARKAAFDGVNERLA